MEDKKTIIPVEFRVMPNGPLMAKGEFTIIFSSGKTIKVENEAFFCRCGNSKAKPFCDGSHRKNFST
jgi:CDGSH-type Zn-finger protein